MDAEALRSRVVVARHHRRRGAAAQAWSLLADAIRQAARPIAEVITTHHGRHSTHHAILSATLDALLAAGVDQVRVVGDTHNFRRLGYAAEAWGRPVRLVDRGIATGTDPHVCRVLLGITGAPISPQPVPLLCLVDAFDSRRLVAAGTDPVAVAAVAARRATLDPASIALVEATETPFLADRTPPRPHTRHRELSSRATPPADA